MTDMSMYDQLAESVGAPGSEIIAKIFKFLTDDDEAKILVAASPPASVDEMSQATGIPAPRVQELVDALFQKGMMFKSKKKNPSRYYRVRQIVQFHDSTAVSRDLSPELVALWKEYMDSEWTAYREKITAALPSPRLRVIPVNITIQPETQILPFDDIITLINDADNIAVTACACRAIERACDTPDDTCLQLNRAADYAVERGTGRKLTREEAIDILKMCEEKGLVHSASNQRGPGHVICNCCDCCCMFWAKMGYVVPSRFQAAVEPEACTACEICIDRCRFDAITIEDGQDTISISAETCMGCGLCLSSCPESALTLQQIRPEEHIPV